MRALAFLALLLLASHGSAQPRPQPVDVQVRRLGHGEQMLTFAPSGITVTIPYDQVGQLYTGPRLAQVRECDMEWDHEFARVANAAVPFDALVAHVGTGEFCNDGYFGDMHTRVYLLDQPVVEVVRAIRRGAAAEIDRLGCGALPRDAPPDPRRARWAPRTRFPGWTYVPVRYQRWYGDYGGAATIMFFVRRVRDRTVVLAFMYVWSPVYETDVRHDPIEETVTSVR